MKRLLSVLMLSLLAAPLSAQAPGIQNPAPRGFRFFLAPVAQVTQLNEEVAVTTGLEFGWMVTQNFTLGFTSYRLANAIEADRPDLDGDGTENIEFFYGGITAAYAVPVTPRVRIEAKALLGGAEAHWRESYWAAVPDKDHRDEEHRTSLVAEPSLGMELQITPWLRAEVAGSYRYVNSGKSHVIEQRDMRGFGGSLGLRFGRF